MFANVARRPIKTAHDDRNARWPEREPLGHAAEVAAGGAGEPERLSMYDHPPVGEIEVERFEELGVNRLKVLKAIENATLRSEAIPADICRTLLPLSLSGPESVQDVYNDCVSHFVLRLVYSRTPDLRQWFVKHEALLFAHRFQMETTGEKKRFLASLKAEEVRRVGAEEKRRVIRELQACLGEGRADFEARTEDVVVVPMEAVPALVARRAAYLEGGFAYILYQDQVAMVIQRFREHLEKALLDTSKILPRIVDEDTRLRSFIHDLTTAYLSTNSPYTSPSSREVKPDQVDGLNMHFPPCMFHSHRQLVKERHLKHGGRLQLSLFLKGLGLKMEDALVYWRKKFDKVTDEAYKKNGYAYNIRYNYGQEGKRMDFSPFGCSKICSSTPATGDAHGCPFKSFDTGPLRQLLMQMGCPMTDIESIVNLKQTPTMACTRYFEVTRKVRVKALNVRRRKYKQQHGDANGTGESQASHAFEIPDTISHPNEFAALSMMASKDEAMEE